MAFLGGLNKLLGRAGNTVKRDIVKPVQNATQVLLKGNQSPVRPTTAVPPINLKNAPIQQQITPDPRIWDSSVTQATQNAGKTLGFTNQFAQNLLNAYPKTGGIVPSSALANKSGAAAEYFPGNHQTNQIALGKGYGQTPIAVLHEGLHRSWDNNPQDRQDFTKAYDSTNDPQLRKYLQGRVSPYSSAKKLMDSGGVYKNNFSRIENLPPNLRNEVHSYIPEYYNTHPPVKYEDGTATLGISPSLSNYYKRYYSQQSYTPRRRLGSGPMEN